MIGDTVVAREEGWRRRRVP
jgi:hypothetical protein